MEFTEEKKKEIEQAIVDACISALEQGAIKEEEMGVISAFVLDRIDLVKNKQELEIFLFDLMSKWKFFTGIYEIEKGESAGENDQKLARQAEQLVKDGNIEEAIAVVKSAGE